jgi:histidyl-tRNA synthetase
MNKLKRPKGTLDSNPYQMAVREKAFEIIKSIFKKHGGEQIDTPVFELKETLMGKYGEDSKLIYDLADQGGEILSLRYDLTIPFVRYLTTNNTKQKMKRYHIAKVYRRDKQSIKKAKFREFFQCDFDITGDFSPLVSDSECILILTEIIDKLNIGNYIVKLNHRKFLDSMMDVCGVPKEKFRSICSAIDKLDKLSWKEVKNEMIVQKGLNPKVTELIGDFVNIKGEPFEILEKLKNNKLFKDHKMAQESFKELKLLFNYLEIYNCINKVTFDLSLARGLDYYTGSIYECVLLNNNVSIGSIAAGGRYDGLIKKSGNNIPSVGISIGISRILSILEKQEKHNVRPINTQVYVCSHGKKLLKERMKICSYLWNNNISAEFSYDINPKIKKQLAYASNKQIPFAIIFGEDEIKENVVQIKNLITKKQEKIQRNKIIKYFKK